MISRSGDHKKNEGDKKKQTATECLKLVQQSVSHVLGHVYEHNRYADDDEMLPIVDRPDSKQMRNLAIDIGSYSQDLANQMTDIAFELDRMDNAVDPDHEYEFADKIFPLARELKKSLTDIAYTSGE